MKRSSGPRKTASNLPESIHQQLNMYAIAAGAAGVSVLALPQSSEAKIVYTPVNVKIVQNGGLFSFDLNHDGIPDFGLSNKYVATTSRAYGTLKVVQSRQANEIWGVNSKGILCAAALPEGIRVGPKGRFQKDPATGLVMALASFDTYFGPWLKVKQAYLGLKFVIKGKTHFGWARVKLSIDSISITATLTGYAYETIPGEAIKAGQKKEAADDPTNDDSSSGASLIDPIPDTPQPVSLGMLALGAQGVPLWQRKESALPE